MTHEATIQRERSKVTRETLYARGACRCGWQGPWQTCRTIDGFQAAERDAHEHVAAASRPRFTAADCQAFALNRGWDSETARDFSGFVDAVQSAYPESTLERHWNAYQETRQDEALDL